MSQECFACGCTPDQNGACACSTGKTHSCGYCGSEVVDGEKCFCRGTAYRTGSDVPSPTSFDPTGDGIRITFKNGWSVLAEKAEPTVPEKVKIQVFMPQGFLIRAFGREEFIVNCNDLAVILMQSSQIPGDVEASEEYATQSFEAMIEGLIFGVAA